MVHARVDGRPRGRQSLSNVGHAHQPRRGGPAGRAEQPALSRCRRSLRLSRQSRMEFGKEWLPRARGRSWHSGRRRRVETERHDRRVERTKNLGAWRRRGQQCRPGGRDLGENKARPVDRDRRPARSRRQNGREKNAHRHVGLAAVGSHSPGVGHQRRRGSDSRQARSALVPVYAAKSGRRFNRSRRG